jgi:GGDEF domain-containing protein
MNDQFGHPAGDQVLREIAHLMGNNFRSHDVVCRMGGEEFAVVQWDGRGETESNWQVDGEERGGATFLKPCTVCGLCGSRYCGTD